MGIQILGLSKNYGTFTALNDIHLEISSGELVALLGPSGSGKTSLLRTIAGLEEVEKGRIFFDGEDATHRDVRNRQVGFVFQHYALFNHMTVFENIAFGLRVRPRKFRPSKDQIRAKVTELLALVQLNGLENRYPSQLSGGQRQRVALARALAIEPKVLLLDEPFGALDAQVRQELRRWLRQLHDELHITSVFVTHDQEEALEIADRVVVMNKGRIEQVGTPEEVYNHPVNPFVLNFLGRVNLIHGHPDQQHPEVLAYARPHEIDVFRHPTHHRNIKAVIQRIVYLGPVTRLELKRKDNGDFMEVEISKERSVELDLKTGEEIFVYPRDLHFFDEDYRPNNNRNQYSIVV
jgi:sulfate/thiosulfate transport system ATP-binding protein